MKEKCGGKRKTSKKNVKRRKTQKKGGMDSIKKPIAYRPRSPNSLINQYKESSINDFSHMDPEERMKYALHSLPHDPVNYATFRKAYMKDATIEEDIEKEITELTQEGSAYWESPTLSIPTTKENKTALKEHLEGKNKQRRGV